MTNDHGGKPAVRRGGQRVVSFGAGVGEEGGIEAWSKWFRSVGTVRSASYSREKERRLGEKRPLNEKRLRRSDWASEERSGGESRRDDRVRG
jgi:hypothetical protein